MSFFQEGFLYRIFASGKIGNDVFFFVIKPLAILLCCVIIPYLLGSINSAVIISTKQFRDDIRRHGSGNAGATNMLRTFGGRGAIPTIVGDAVKAALSMLIAGACCGFWWAGGFSLQPSDPSLFVLSVGEVPIVTGTYLAGVFCIIGHVFPIYYRFKGGKGVLCAFVIAAMLNLSVALVLLLVFLILVAFTRYVSLGSVVAAALYPIFMRPLFRMSGLEPPIYIMLFSFFIAAIIIYKHIPNIKRILDHEESKISFRRKEVPSETDPDANTGDGNDNK